MPAFPWFQSHVVGLLLGFAVVCAVPLDAVQAQGTGRIQGKVIETETDRPLGGARVQLRRSTLVAITDHRGSYVIPRAPAGTDTLEVAYIGRQRQANR